MQFGNNGSRRSSALAKQLQKMQNAARKQEEMYNCFMGAK